MPEIQTPTKRDAVVVAVKRALSTRKNALAQLMPPDVRDRLLSPERLMQLAIRMVETTPALQECTVPSIIGGVLSSAQLGLQLEGVTGEAYLVPFKNKKTGRKSATFIPGYKGLRLLALRSGVVEDVYSVLVYKGDTFEELAGTDPQIVHKRAKWGHAKRTEGADNVIGGYFVGVFRSGHKRVLTMSRAQMEEIRKRSPARDSGPWITDREAMYLKTLIRKGANQMPLSAVDMRYVANDELFDSGDEAAGTAYTPPVEEAMKGVEDEPFDGETIDVQASEKKEPEPEPEPEPEEPSESDELDALGEALAADAEADEAEHAKKAAKPKRKTKRKTKAKPEPDDDEANTPADAGLLNKAMSAAWQKDLGGKEMRELLDSVAGHTDLEHASIADVRAFLAAVEKL